MNNKCKNRWYKKAEHNFGNWVRIEQGDTLRGDKVVGNYIVQRRECKDCGFTELGKQVI